MGILRNGIFGGFSKKTGALVGVQRGAQNIIRSLPPKSSKPPTAAQQMRRAIFGELSSWLSAIKPLVDLGFAQPGAASSAMNRAIRANLKQALVESPTGSALDYRKIGFSEGKLPLPAECQAQSLLGKRVAFSWVYHPYEEQWKAGDDCCSVLVYNVDKHQFAFQIDAARRESGHFIFALPEAWLGDMVNAYLSFFSCRLPISRSNTHFIDEMKII